MLGINVGATREAIQILSPLNQRFYQPARYVIRIMGFLMLAYVAYLTFLFPSDGEMSPGIIIWMICYLCYLFVLEISRIKLTQYYETTPFRILRVGSQLLFITVLLVVIHAELHTISYFYWIPIFAAIAYFMHSTPSLIFVFLLAVFGLFFSTQVFPPQPLLSPLQISIISLILFIGSIAFWYFYKSAVQLPDNLLKISEKLRTILNIHDLIVEIAKTCGKITATYQIFVIVIDPDTKRYIGHFIRGLEFLPGKSIEDVIDKCQVLKNGLPFESGDMQPDDFNNHPIYQSLFTQKPASVITEPIITKDNKIIGVISVSSSIRNYYSKNTIANLQQFMPLINGSVENSITYRKLQLSKSAEISESDLYSEYMTDEELFSTLAIKAQDEFGEHVPCVIHRYDPNSEELIPAYASGYDIPHDPLPDRQTGNKKDRLRFGVGVAGKAIQYREPILVPDSSTHPWFVQTSSDTPIRSILVAPLLDPVEKNQPIGTISVLADHPNAFNLQDEIILYSIAIQAAHQLLINRSYKAYREQGGSFKKIFDAFRQFYFEIDEDILCNKIVTAAINVLDFSITRIRMYDPSTDDLVTRAIAGVPEDVAEKLEGDRLPRSALEPFLTQKYQVGDSYQIPHDDTAWRQVVDRYFYVTPESTQKKIGWLSYDAFLTPLMDLDGDLIGLLSFDHPRSGKPSIKEIEEVDVFSRGASWVFERADKRRGLSEKQQRTIAFIDSISELMKKGGDFDSVGNTVVQVGANLLSAEGCTLHLVEGEQIVLRYSNYLSGPEFIGTSKPIAEEACGLTSYVAAKGEIIRGNNDEFKKHKAFAGETKHIPFLKSEHCYSLLKVPIFTEDLQVVVGVLTLENKKRYGKLVSFDEKDEKDLCMLASEVATALEISNRYQSLKIWERTGLEDDLHDLINWYHSGVCLFIDAAKDRLDKGETAKGIEVLSEVQKRAYTTVSEMKTLHSALTRNYLAIEDFEQSLELMVQSWSDRIGIPLSEFPVFINCQPDIQIPPQIKNIMLRIASNAFTNCIKYSGVVEDGSVEININANRISNRIVMAVIDNGFGKSVIRSGFGVQRMEQLTDLLKKNELVDSARLEIESKEQIGTKVILTIMLKLIHT